VASGFRFRLNFQRTAEVVSWLLAAGLAGVVAGCDTNVAGPDVSFRVVAEGSTSGFSTRNIVVIKDAAAWATLLASLQPARPPEPVIFPSEMAVAVLMGERPTGGYRVRVVRVASHDRGFEIEALEEQPHPSCAVTQALTRPFAVIALARTDLSVTATWTTATGIPCR